MYNPIQYTDVVVHILYLYCSYQMKKVFDKWSTAAFPIFVLLHTCQYFCIHKDIVVYFCRGCFNLAFCSFSTEVEVWQIETQNFKVVSNRFFERVFVKLNFTELCLLHTETRTVSQIHINVNTHEAQEITSKMVHICQTHGKTEALAYMIHEWDTGCCL